MLSHDKPEKQTILLEYLRDEEAVKYNDYPFKAEQDRVRKVLIGCSRMLDNKLEKNVNFELNAKVSRLTFINLLFRKRISISNVTILKDP